MYPDGRLLTTAERLDGPAPAIEFIFWRHIDENIDELIPELNEAEVILIESSPLLGKRDKTLTEALTNQMLGAELTRRQRGTLQYMMPGIDIDAFTYEVPAAKALCDRVLEGELLAIIKKFHGTGKVLRLLDANPEDHPEVAQSVADTYRQQDELNQANANRTMTSIDEYKAGVRQYVTKFGESLGDRDEIIIGQIAEYRSEFPDRKIAVVYGHNHTAISFPFLLEGNASRKFINRPEHSTVKQSYNIDAQAERHVRFGREIPEELIERHILKGVLMLNLIEHETPVVDTGKLIDDMRQFEPQTIKLSDRAEKLASHISQAGLAQFIEMANQVITDPDDENQAKLKALVDKIIAGQLVTPD